ncbi:hypothetical protein [Psychroflexus sp. ALD_RP9]|uniref:hypothetical protein n=1 Tax=Psychroflexus sp. ALD_RP9 TaxID=2777186 RepID=UPI001A8EB364|nr:hypothetical protein [Psychroflexus sp. ALD_RP9]QSS97250.1 hypothetical protein IMZ30_00595 [Psychroflexus sp. ALD_RP9]
MKFTTLFICIVSMSLISCSTTKPSVGKPKTVINEEKAIEKPEVKTEVITVIDFISKQSIGGVSGAFVGNQMDVFAKKLQQDFPNASINRVAEGIEFITSTQNKTEVLKKMLGLASNYDFNLVLDENNLSTQQLNQIRSEAEVKKISIIVLNSDQNKDKTFLEIGFIANDVLISKAIEQTKD